MIDKQQQPASARPLGPLDPDTQDNPRGREDAAQKA
jgi:hypothetical protein